VADLRAATPSHAAQVLWTERAVLRQQADEMFLALSRGMGRYLDGREGLLNRQVQGLVWNSPARRIERGGFELERLADRLRQAASRLAGARRAAVSRLDERLRRAFGPVRILALQSELDRTRTALAQSASALVGRRRDALRDLEGRLAALDPAAPLSRGYALVRGRDGFVRSRLDVRPGDTIRIQVSDGEFGAEVLP
jgi:exodeoxyribonuclease VII large subunit